MSRWKIEKINSTSDLKYLAYPIYEETTGLMKAITDYLKIIQIGFAFTSKGAAKEFADKKEKEYQKHLNELFYGNCWPKRFVKEAQEFVKKQEETIHKVRVNLDDPKWSDWNDVLKKQEGVEE